MTTALQKYHSDQLSEIGLLPKALMLLRSDSLERIQDSNPPRPHRPKLAAGALIPRGMPITGNARCCARAASDHAAAAPPSVAKNFRRPMWLAMCPLRLGVFHAMEE